MTDAGVPWVPSVAEELDGVSWTRPFDDTTAYGCPGIALLLGPSLRARRMPEDDDEDNCKDVEDSSSIQVSLVLQHSGNSLEMAEKR